MWRKVRHFSRVENKIGMDTDRLAPLARRVPWSRVCPGELDAPPHPARTRTAGLRPGAPTSPFPCAGAACWIRAPGGALLPRPCYSSCKIIPPTPAAAPLTGGGVAPLPALQCGQAPPVPPAAARACCRRARTRRGRGSTGSAAGRRSAIRMRSCKRGRNNSEVDNHCPDRPKHAHWQVTTKPDFSREMPGFSPNFFWGG